MAIDSRPGIGRELPTVSVTEIPPLPEAALHILSVARKPNASAADVAAALGTDPGIALRFLSIANSAFFSANQRITTLPHCVAWLGLEFVKATLVTLGIRYNDPAGDSPYLTRTALWQHNMAVATCCEMICHRITGWQPGEAYTTGLTHDVGKQILLLTHREAYEPCLAQATSEFKSLYLVEDEALGMDHALVGAMALREWQLSMELVHAVLNHHEEELNTQQGKMIAILQMAHHVCHRIGYGSAGGALPNLDSRAQERLGLSADDVSALADDLAESVDSLDSIIGAIAA